MAQTTSGRVAVDRPGSVECSMFDIFMGCVALAPRRVTRLESPATKWGIRQPAFSIAEGACGI